VKIPKKDEPVTPVRIKEKQNQHRRDEEIEKPFERHRRHVAGKYLAVGLQAKQ
jgi:hypothetical protein